MRKLGIVCALSLVAGQAGAVPITWVASGTVSGGNYFYELPLTPAYGEQFTYSITFESETLDTDASPTNGNFPGAIQAMTFSVGGESFDLPIGPGILTSNYNTGTGVDYRFSIMSQTGPYGSYPSSYSVLEFVSSSPLAFDTNTAPTMLPADPNIFQVRFALGLMPYAPYPAPVPGLFGQVTSIVQQTASVPEPATAVLLATSLIGMGLARRRRRTLAA